MSIKTLRCAIYTRKSSEEGLEQSFNSLDAQHDACAAYIVSQASEGWQALATHYDDGGYSGGSMERPGLKRLLADIAANKIDIVVVYKIDRLTRSLADFARIVEVFEQHDCSFVSVTQSFNTTSSMGRLMLNVLLSFAQFEREVTGERIRDKIAASKAKGMWMGGHPPLGYDLPSNGCRVLQVNEAEAVTVTSIYTRYLEVGSVHALERDLAERGVCSKRWTTTKGKAIGGVPFSRGALFHLLRNQVYLGKIRHKDVVHQGEHPAIVDAELFARVQRHLDANARRHRGKSAQRSVKAPLTGRLFDAAGEPMSPTVSHGKSGRSYRYYVSASRQQGRGSVSNHQQRLSAPTIERIVAETLSRWLPQEEKPLDRLAALRLHADGLLFELAGVRPQRLASELSGEERLIHHDRENATVLLPLALPLRGGERLVVRGQQRAARPDPVLIAALRRAHAMLEIERGQPRLHAAPASPYDRMILRLAFLSPAIQRDILAGRQPREFNLETFKAIEVPLSWSQQRAALAWNA